MVSFAEPQTSRDSGYGGSRPSSSFGDNQRTRSPPPPTSSTPSEWPHSRLPQQSDDSNYLNHWLDAQNRPRLYPYPDDTTQSATSFYRSDITNPPQGYFRRWPDPNTNSYDTTDPRFTDTAGSQMPSTDGYLASGANKIGFHQKLAGVLAERGIGPNAATTLGEIDAPYTLKRPPPSADTRSVPDHTKFNYQPPMCESHDSSNDPYTQSTGHTGYTAHNLRPPPPHSPSPAREPKRSQRTSSWLSNPGLILGTAAMLGAGAGLYYNGNHFPSLESLVPSIPYPNLSEVASSIGNAATSMASLATRGSKYLPTTENMTKTLDSAGRFMGNAYRGATDAASNVSGSTVWNAIQNAATVGKALGTVRSVGSMFL